MIGYAQESLDRERRGQARGGWQILARLSDLIERHQHAAVEQASRGWLTARGAMRARQVITRRTRPQARFIALVQKGGRPPFPACAPDLPLPLIGHLRSRGLARRLAGACGFAAWLCVQGAASGRFSARLGGRRGHARSSLVGDDLAAIRERRITAKSAHGFRVGVSIA